MAQLQQLKERQRQQRYLQQQRHLQQQQEESIELIKLIQLGFLLRLIHIPDSSPSLKENSFSLLHFYIFKQRKLNSWHKNIKDFVKKSFF